MKHFYLFIFLISFIGYGQLTPPSELQSYYNGVNFNLTGNDLYNSLATTTIDEHSPQLYYSQRHDYLYDADADQNNASNVILIYTGESRYEQEYISGNNLYQPQTFNTEHVYPKSLLEGIISEADLHLLRVCDETVNSNRGNNPFADGSGSYANYTTAWYPGDDWKGDVARIIMYANLRYGEPFTDVGTLNLFLDWNSEDPVSDIETQRNTVINGAQGNRNPFIDNPYLATLIWGGITAENKWAPLANSKEEITAIKFFPNPIKQNKLYFNLNSSTEIKIYDVLGKLIKKEDLDQSKSQLNISDLNKGVYLVRMSQGNHSITKKLIRQ